MVNNYNLTSLKRWSCKSKEIPGIASIKSIHVYDFDNTLFSSPLPNPQLWHPSVIGLLQGYEVFAHGGWWHEPGILGATGEGVEKEEQRAWEGWWNDVVVQLVEASMSQKDVLTVMLTGRGETNFAELLNRMCNSKKLDFDLVVLKPEVGPQGQRFSSTLEFKTEFFKELVFTYKNADEVRVYEDRVKHVKSFRDYFEKLNKSLLSHPADQPPPQRKPITAEVIHVCELKATLDPEAEIAAVQRAINRHNKAIKTGGPNPTGAPARLLHIKENFVYFGYLISQNDSARLLTLCNTPPHLVDSGEVKYMASNILIAPFYPRQDILEKVGGRGNKVTWQVNGIAKFEDRIWAARVAPVSVPESQIYTQDPTPLVVLAIRKGARPIDAARIQNWQPVAPEKQFIFESVVGDRVMLKIEEIDEDNPRGPRRGYGGINKRKFGQEDESHHNDNNSGKENVRNTERQGQGQGRNFGGKRDQFNNRRNNNHNNNNQNKNNNNQGGGGNNHRNKNNNHNQGSNQGRSRGGGRGNGPAYKSLDDHGGGNFDGAGDSKAQQDAMVMNY